jgi:hypothetical protein
MKSFTVPDIIWPSSNEFGVPDLLPELQPSEVALPFEKWGDQARTKAAGTYHFYTEDYKFENVWRYPLQPVKAGVKALVECNFSTGNGQPLAVSLWDIYRKRWLSRFWQSRRVPVWVDLNVDESLLDYALLGVPQGWRAYCSRGADNDYLHLFGEYEAARKLCGDNPLFLVYGGGSLMENICLDRGWLWQPENMNVKSAKNWRWRRGLQLRIMEFYV